MNILMVLTSHDELGSTGYRTGIWLDGFTSAYYIFKDAGHEVVLASPRGIDAPVDPRSDLPATQTESMRRFKQDREARQLLADTVRLDEVDAGDFDAAMVVGGHGQMFDLADDPKCATLLSQLHGDGKPIALVCHGPAALRNALNAECRPLVESRHVTAYSNSEEKADGLAGILPFSLQDEMIRLGAWYSKGADGKPYVIRDGLLITGQNAASTAATAQALLDTLREFHPVSPQ